MYIHVYDSVDVPKQSTFDWIIICSVIGCKLLHGC